MPDGSEQPVGFASRTLTNAEENYSQMEKEALACIFGIKQFQSYIYGHHFTLQTDHRPLLALFNEKRLISPQASGRIQRWALLLASYDYSIACRTTAQHANADAFSRLPIPEVPVQTPVPPEVVFVMDALDDAPMTAVHVATLTQRDPLLSRVSTTFSRDGPTR